jgi:hypothetical protein
VGRRLELQIGPLVALEPRLARLDPDDDRLVLLERPLGEARVAVGGQLVEPIELVEQDLARLIELVA